MAFTSASLPFPNHVNYRGRRVGFEVGEPKGFWARTMEKLVELVYYAIHAPTGSPSDGMGGDTESSTSTQAFIATQKMLTAEKDGEDWEVDEIVVSGEDSRKLGMGTNSEPTTSASPHHSSHDGDSSRGDDDNILVHHSPSTMSVLHSKWLVVVAFFFPRFDEESSEMEFRKQHWYSTKAWAFYGSLYLIINWVLYLILNLNSTKHTVYAQILFYGGLSLLTIPLPFLIAFDIPFHHRISFQIWFAAAVWYCGITETIQLHICHFFVGTNECFGKDFLATMYYTTGLPALMMFVVSDRLYNAILQVAEFVLLMVLVIPVQGIYARNVVSFVLFSLFLQGLHYNREMTERRLYLLNTQLKVAYKAQQKAQMAQARASHEKRRFASYIFHEVRVPLNNAAIAFNNMTTSEAFREEFLQEHNLSEDVEALDVSLATVQQVLNDSLDLEKMDAGHFDINPRPFPLHRVIRSTLGPLIVSAAAKNLVLHVDLDEKIDSANENRNGQPQAPGSRTHTPILDNSPSSTRTTGSGGSTGIGIGSSGSDLFFTDASRIDLDGTWVVGDEVRLRQILTNLASNAVKFTPEGVENGVTVRTMLVERRMSTGGGGSDEQHGKGLGNKVGGGKEWRNGAWVRGSGDLEKGGSVGHGEQGSGVYGDGEKRHRPQSHSHQDHHHHHHNAVPQEFLVFRLEVSDSGPGIKPSELADNQLFQPFAQTKVGKLNKNSTGLGLAIVRQIVNRSGGRLGVQSQKGRGATFWVELSYPIAPTPTPDVQVLVKSSPEMTTATARAAANATALHSGRWPTIAFAEDVKPPMITVGSPLRTVTTVPMPPIPLTPLPLPALPPSPEYPESALPSPSLFKLGSDTPLLAEQMVRSISEQTAEAKKPTIKEEGEVAAARARTTVDVQASPLAVEDDGPLSVLIVDDNMITREAMSRSLRKRGCIVETAKDGKECLDMVLGPESKMYDLISLDNDMPVMTGEEAVKEIRQAGRSDIFVVGCTGNALTDDQTRYLDAGADRILVKPLRFEVLADILEVAKQKRRQRRVRNNS